MKGNQAIYDEIIDGLMGKVPVGPKAGMSVTICMGEGKEKKEPEKEEAE
jgi:hypothetical protein